MTTFTQVGRVAGALAISTALFGVSRTAHAVNCKDLPTPIYGLGGNSPKPLIKAVATALTKAGAETIVYQAPSQCTGINGLVGNLPMTGTASYWDAAGKEQSCDLDLAGNAIDLAVSNTSAGLCPSVQLPSNVGEFLGPVQSFNFIVPKASKETSISAAAAYFVYGFGQAGQAAPWTDETQIFKRDQNSGAAILTALAINVPVNKLKGVDAKSTANTITLVSSAPNPDAAIGLVSGEAADANQATVTTLAYQHYGQTCGYWPSSTATSFDKKNIRDGHYFIWEAVHFYAYVDAANKPTSPGAAKLLGYFTGTVPLPAGVDLLAAEIKAGTVPDCAMQVKRISDLGDYASYTPAASCGCYFDEAATGQTTCQTCQNDGACPASASHCRYGYCEVN